jgi:hypothetical protein
VIVRLETVPVIVAPGAAALGPRPGCRCGSQLVPPRRPWAERPDPDDEPPGWLFATDPNVPTTTALPTDDRQFDATA